MNNLFNNFKTISGHIRYNNYDDHHDQTFITPNNFNEIITSIISLNTPINILSTNINILSTNITTSSNYISNKLSFFNTELTKHKENKSEEPSSIHVTSKDIQNWNQKIGKSTVYSVNSLTGYLTMDLNKISDSNGKIANYIFNNQIEVGLILSKFNLHRSASSYINNNIEYHHITDTEINTWNNKLGPTDIYVSSLNNRSGSAIDISFTKDDLDTYTILNTLAGNITINQNNQFIKPIQIDNGYNIQITAIQVPIGTLIWWFGTTANIPAGWHICDGTPIPENYELRTILELTNYPLLTDDRYIHGAYNANILGNAGVPDITGYINTFGAFGGGGGAFVYKRTGGDTPKMESGTQNCASNMTFQASHYNETYTIYGKSDTVTPKHITAIPIIKAYYI